MTIYGAIPAELRALGLRLTAQIDSIAGIQDTVSTALHGTTWTGPAREQFESQWDSAFNASLNGLKEAFGSAGKECAARADGLEQVMGSAGG